MRRIGRHLFTILAAASLLLCLATCAVWTRVYVDGVVRSWKTEEPGLAHVQYAVVERGVLILKAETDVDLTPDRTPKEWIGRYSGGVRGHSAIRKPDPPWHRFEFERVSIGTYRRSTRVAIPLWSVAIALLVLPTVWTLKWRNLGKRLVEGRCPSCGYDLRAHAAGERCPECGTAVGR